MASIWQYDIENRNPTYTVTITPVGGMFLCEVKDGPIVKAWAKTMAADDSVLKCRRSLDIPDNVLPCLSDAQRATVDPLAIGVMATDLAAEKLLLMGASELGPVIEVVERGLELSSSKNGHPGKNVTANGAIDIGWTIPVDYKTLVSLDILVDPGGTNASADIDLASNYGAVGEPSSQHAESNTAITYSLTNNVIAALDVSSVFSSLSAGDWCGLNLDLNGIGGSAHFLGSRLRYKP